MSGAGISGDVGADVPSALGATAALHVEAVFHDLAPEQADAISAELIARAHELANMPEHGCDVDVNVRREPSGTGGVGSV
ncbi:MAG TPA: hypothetical protein VGI24_09405 [Solirubrobacteraceae bacterium]